MCYVFDWDGIGGMELWWLWKWKSGRCLLGGDGCVGSVLCFVWMVGMWIELYVVNYVV